MHWHGGIFTEKVLVVAPFSLLGVWESELQRFAGVPVNAVVLQGTLDRKKQLLNETAVDKLNVIIVNYESAWRMEKELLAYDLTPRGIMEMLHLREVDYNQVSAYGHFGKAGLPWEE